jgi:hypothetical protein
VHGLLQDAEDARRTRPERSHRSERDERAEAEEEEHLGEGAVDACQEHGDDDDRPELPGDAGAEHGRAERGRQQPCIGEDRNERAQRGRRKGDAEQPSLGIEAGLGEQRAHDQTDPDRDRPALGATHELAPRHALLDHLEPRKEEQEHEPDVGEELEVRVHLRDVEHLGADHDPQHDLDDHRGQDETVVQPREDRRDARHREDEHERADVGRGHCGGDGAMPHAPVVESPGSRRITASPLRKAFGGHVIGSTAKLRRATSGRESPVNSIRYP